MTLKTYEMANDKKTCDEIMSEVRSRSRQPIQGLHHSQITVAITYVPTDVTLQHAKSELYSRLQAMQHICISK